MSDDNETPIVKGDVDILRRALAHAEAENARLRALLAETAYHVVCHRPVPKIDDSGKLLPYAVPCGECSSCRAKAAADAGGGV